jgi:hypothetical protein
MLLSLCIFVFAHSQAKRHIAQITQRFSAVYLELFTRDGILTELGAITSLPGAEQQRVHSDVVFGESMGCCASLLLFFYFFSSSYFCQLFHCHIISHFARKESHLHDLCLSAGH